MGGDRSATASCELTSAVRRIEKPLQENQIQPATKFMTNFFKMGHALKAQPLMEADGTLIGGVNRADHHVFIECNRQRE